MTHRTDLLVIPAMPAYRRAMLAFAITAACIIGGVSVLAVVTRPPVHSAAAGTGAQVAMADVRASARPGS